MQSFISKYHSCEWKKAIVLKSKHSGISQCNPLLSGCLSDFRTFIARNLFRGPAAEKEFGFSQIKLFG